MSGLRTFAALSLRRAGCYGGWIDITLTPEQTAWLDARVAAGESTSVEQAVRRLVDEAMTREPDAADDLAWAKPLVDEALASIARGAVISLDDHRAHTAALLARLGD